MRSDFAYRVKPGEQILVGSDAAIRVSTVSAVHSSPVAFGRDEVEIATTDGKVLRLWADQVVVINEQGEDQ